MGRNEGERGKARDDLLVGRTRPHVFGVDVVDEGRVRAAQQLPRDRTKMTGNAAFHHFLKKMRITKGGREQREKKISVIL